MQRKCGVGLAVVGASLLLGQICAVGAENRSVAIVPLNIKSKDTVSTVVTKTGRTWMDRNLGASQLPQSSNDSAAYGDLYQFGRYTDGHEKRNSPTTTTLSPRDFPTVFGYFIISNISPNDWRSPQNPDLWQSERSDTNPCPSGFRIPTFDEWYAEFESWNSRDAQGGYDSPLKITIGGYRRSNTGSIVNAGVAGYYASKNHYEQQGPIWFQVCMSITNNDAGGVEWGMANGVSVRCIKD